MTIQNSILSLTKKSNGYFKSGKQKDFLVKQLKMSQGYFGAFNSGYHKCPLFATWDDKGIIKTSKSTVNGMVTLFERKVDGVVSELETKNRKKIKRKIKKLQKQLLERQTEFETIGYSGNINVYWKYTNKLIKEIKYLTKKI